MLAEAGASSQSWCWCWCWCWAVVGRDKEESGEVIDSKKEEPEGSEGSEGSERSEGKEGKEGKESVTDEGARDKFEAVELEELVVDANVVVVVVVVDGEEEEEVEKVSVSSSCFETRPTRSALRQRGGNLTPREARKALRTGTVSFSRSVRDMACQSRES